MKTEREVFDEMALHMLTQKQQSRKGDSCAYRGEGGAKCAIGCLISDNAYHPSLEGKSLTDLKVIQAVAASGYPAIRSFLLMYGELQRVHDCVMPAHWAENLQNLGEGYFGPDYTLPEVSNG